MTNNPFRFIWKNIGTVITALVLAITVWVSAVIANDPNEEGEIPYTPELHVVGLDENLDYIGEIPESVVVIARAPGSVWEELSINPGLVRAKLDFTGLGPGEYELPVTIEYGISPVLTMEISPALIPIKLESLVSKEGIIHVELVGETALGFTADNPRLSTTRVEVYGPQSLVELVEEVRAVISIAGARDTVSSQITLQPVDEDGQVISGVSLSPGTITVTVKVVQAGGYRDVAVRVETIGTPLAGYRVTHISVSPPTVTLFSSDPQLVLDIPGFVSTLPLDLTDASDDIEVRLALDLPEGITMVGDEQSVQVQVGIAAIETSITLTVPIQIIGLGPGLEAEVSPTTVDVFLTGPVTVLDALNPEDIIVFVSLTDLGPGSYLVEPQVDVLPDKVVLENINPPTIEVIITGTVIPTETPPVLTPTPTPTPTPEP